MFSSTCATIYIYTPYFKNSSVVKIPCYLHLFMSISWEGWAAWCGPIAKEKGEERRSSSAGWLAIYNASEALKLRFATLLYSALQDPSTLIFEVDHHFWFTLAYGPKTCLTPQKMIFIQFLSRRTAVLQKFEVFMQIFVCIIFEY